MSWKPDRSWVEESNVYKYMVENNLNALEDFVEFTHEKPEIFWDSFVKLIGLRFYKEYDRVLDLSGGKEWAKWFVNGKVNVGGQIPDSSEVFIKWMDEKGEGQKVTYSQVLSQAKSISSWLKKTGLKKGDTVGIYLPMIPETVSIYLGIARAGMIAVPLFSGFGKEPIKVRAEDSGMKVIFTTDYTIRKGNDINMLKNLEGLDTKLVVFERGGTKGDFTTFKEVLRTGGDGLEITDSEDPFMIIYTSGTTGKPKGCVHTHDGFPVKASADIYFQFDMKKGETLMWVTDLGWMMGPWMITGGLLLNGKIGMIEGYVNYSTLTKFIEDYKVDILGLSASLVRLMKSEVEKGRIGVRIAGNTGEPIDLESWKWLYESVKGPVINYSGGTEISGGILGNYVIKEIRASSFNGFSPGIKASVFDEEGRPARPNVEGELVILSVWPGMTRGFWKDRERYMNTYWSRWKGVWVHGDLAYYDQEGYYFIVGRSDDTIKVAGKRIGPAEVEQVINSYANVVESACVGVPSELKGEEILCFVVAKQGVDKEGLLRYTQQMLGKALAPKGIILVKELPKTRNAKIMRRLIRAVVLNKPLGDTSSLENPNSLEEIRKIVSNSSTT
ncbi:AMP-binding protein [Stygiolobus caldivivus]|uniref:acetate--CoA ligase n=1 Tax=Stygiolobus caldivivus TaxID=2824673 RepID=A0A8D5U5I0_9CREN|nr:AMP-binding protein [Stygiolobus caldivivus]BCU69679.1 AMP-dependent synthetase [Stygiolobus caldivivus]